MKRNNLLILALSMILLIMVGCIEPSYKDSSRASNDNGQKANKFLLYEDPIYKVKILYPGAWKFVETKDNIFAFQEPKLNADDKIQENINLIMNDVSGQNITFDKFKDLAMENLKETVQDFSLVESSSTILAGSPAQKIVFTTFNPKLKLLQVITIKDDIAYAITFVSEPDSFETYLDIVQEMLDSFEITGNIKDTEGPEKSEVKSAARNLITQDSIVGTYRCWSYNVQGAGKSCTSPPIVLNQDGSYSMSGERGTYTVNGDTINLSESKIRGTGKILENGNQIRFEYDYTNWHHVITYLKTDWNSASKQVNDAQGIKYVEVSLNIIFPESQGVSGINSASLVPKGEKDITGEAIAYKSKPHTVTASFRKLATKPGIPTGKIYIVQVSSGFGYWEVGEIDLRNVTEDVELNMYAKTADETNSAQGNAVVVQKDTTQTPTESKQIPADPPRCDPNIPKYSQPVCRE